MAGARKIELTERQVELIAKALAEPRRVRILEEIGAYGGPMPCSDLCSLHDCGQATMSHHVKELENAGLIQGTRKGKCMDYVLKPEVLRAYASRIAGIYAIAKGKKR